MKNFFFIGLVLLLISCKSDGDHEGLRTQIKELEDSISMLTANLRPGQQVNPSLDQDLVALLQDYYRQFPDDPYAPECLDKLHMKYSGMGDYKTCALYADTLIDNYPDYVNRAMILESQATNYDFYIQPRDTTKVRYYYELLLKENPDLPEEKREGIKDRLNHLDLTIEQLILRNN